MKKRMRILLAVCMISAFFAATVSANNRTQSSPSLPDDTAQTDVVFLAGTVPAQSGLTEAILPPINALVLSMSEHRLAYNTDSPYFVWNAIYYALSLYGKDDARAHLTDDALILPAESVQDFAHALFADLESLPLLPKEMAEFISYDPSCHEYSLAVGDFAPTATELGPLTPLADGTFAAEGTLTALDEGCVLYSFRAILQENDTMFGFSIVDVCLY